MGFHAIGQQIFRKLHLDSAIARNSLFLMAAEVFRVGTNFVLSILLARYLRPEGLGVWRFVVNYALIFAVLTEAGISRVTVRRMARSPMSEHGRQLQQLLAARLILSAVALAILWLSLLIVPSNRITNDTRFLIALYMFSQVFQAFRKNAEVVWQARQQLLYHASFAIANRVVLLVAIPLALWFRCSLACIVVIYVAVDLLDCLAANMYLYAQRIPFGVSFARRELKSLLWEAFPFGLQFLAQQLRYYFDAVLIKFLFIGDATAGNRQTGLFGAAAPFVISFQFIPNSIAGATYPELARTYIHDKQRFLKLTRATLTILYLVGSSLAATLYLGRHLIINTTVGEKYAEAIPVLAMLAWMSPFFFLNTGLLVIYAGANRQNALTLTNWATTILKILLCLLWIPEGGALGAAQAAVVADFASALVLLVYLSGREIRAVPWRELAAVTAAQLLIASLDSVAQRHIVLLIALLTVEIMIGTVGACVTMRHWRRAH